MTSFLSAQTLRTFVLGLAFSLLCLGTSQAYTSGQFLTGSNQDNNYSCVTVGPGNVFYGAWKATNPSPSFIKIGTFNGSTWTEIPTASFTGPNVAAQLGASLDGIVDWGPESMVVDTSGNIHIVFSIGASVGGAGSLRGLAYGKYTPGPNTWAFRKLFMLQHASGFRNIGNGDYSIKLDSSQNPHVVFQWSDASDDPTREARIQYAYFNGSVWNVSGNTNAEDAIQIDISAFNNQEGVAYLATTFDSAGVLHCCYRKERADAITGDAYYSKKTGPTTWSAPVEIAHVGDFYGGYMVANSSNKITIADTTKVSFSDPTFSYRIITDASGSFQTSTIGSYTIPTSTNTNPGIAMIGINSTGLRVIGSTVSGQNGSTNLAPQFRFIYETAPGVWAQEAGYTDAATQRLSWDSMTVRSSDNTVMAMFAREDADYTPDTRNLYFTAGIPTGYGGAPATSPEMNVKGNGTSIADGDSSPSLTDHTDFGSQAIISGTVIRTFTIENTGTGALTLSGTPKVAVGGAQASEFTVNVQPSSPVAATNGTTTFQVTFDPSGAGVRSATLSIANDDADENPYNFSIQGTGTCPTITVTNPSTTTGTIKTAFSQTFTQSGAIGSATFTTASTLPTGLSLSTAGVLSGTPDATTAGSYPIVVTVTDSAGCTGTGATYTLVIAPTGTIGFTINGTPGDATTGSDAPDGAGTASVGKFDSQVRGGFLAQNGNVVFPANLLIGSGSPPVTVNNFQGLWKDNGSGLKLLARSGSVAPEANSAVWDILPMIPAINDSGEVTFYASLRLGTGSPAVTSNDDTALWTELGSTGLGILIREGDSINATVSGAFIGAFATGAFATAKINATEGSAAFSATLKGSTTDSVILRTDVTGPSVTGISVVAREHFAAPGAGGDTFYNVAGGYSDPCRMDAQGNLAFAAFTNTFKQGIWYQARGGSVVKVVLSGDTAPNTSGATFYPSYLDMPAMGGNGTLAFHAFLNANGDNVANDKNEGIWRGDTTGGFTCILRRGDTNALRPGLGLPSAGAKVGNMTSPRLSNANHMATTAWVDVDGNGTSSSPTDKVGLFTDTSGTLKLVVKEGDAAPGAGGATFLSFDPPVIGGQEQMAFIGALTGTGVTANNDSGVWREGANGTAPVLLLRKGDTLVTSQGTKTIFKLDIPGSSLNGYPADHRWEQPVMDSTGRLVINLIFTDGSTSQVYAP